MAVNVQVDERSTETVCPSEIFNICCMTVFSFSFLASAAFCPPQMFIAHFNLCMHTFSFTLYILFTFSLIYICCPLKAWKADISGFNNRVDCC